MNKYLQQLFSKVLVLLPLLCCNISSASESDPITVAFTFSLPPYLSEDKSSGIERNIIQSALEASGYEELSIINVHYVRAIELSKSGQVDAIVSNQSNSVYSKYIPNIMASDKTLDYVDCAITLSDRKIVLNDIHDYYDKRIWAFKSASEVLGNEFNKMTKLNKDYTENFDQLKQLDMLAMQRIDIAISDRNIFSEKIKASTKYKDLEFSFHEIGQPTPRVIRSSNKELISKFNQGLNLIKMNGRYQEVINHYRLSYASHCTK